MAGTLLHVGCGHAPKPEWAEAWDEIRLDVDPSVQPDILASITDMGDIGPFDVLYTSHTLEHLHPHDVAKALAEFRRVLKPGGFAVIRVPDLEDVKPTDEMVYMSPGGPITGLDMYYGLSALTKDNPYMAHRCAFVRDTLEQLVAEAGFARHQVTRTDFFNLLAVAVA